MLDRAPQEMPDDAVAKPRPVEFRGAGFTAATSRTSGWIALAIVIALFRHRESLSPEAFTNLKW